MQGKYWSVWNSYNCKVCPWVSGSWYKSYPVQPRTSQRQKCVHLFKMNQFWYSLLSHYQKIVWKTRKPAEILSHKKSVCGWVCCGVVWVFFQCISFWSVFVSHMSWDINLYCACSLFQVEFEEPFCSSTILFCAKLPIWWSSQGRLFSEVLCITPLCQFPASKPCRNGKFVGVVLGGSSLQKTTVTKCPRWFHLS